MLRLVVYWQLSIILNRFNTVNNEGTKVQNPRRVYTLYIANTAICIRGQMRECTGKYTDIW